MNPRHQRIEVLDTQMKFARLQAEWRAIALHMAQPKASLAGCLEGVLDAEAQACQEREVATRVKRETMPMLKPREQLHWKAAARRAKAQVLELADLVAIERVENSVLLGPNERRQDAS